MNSLSEISKKISLSMLLQLAGLVISLGLTMYITRSIGAIEYNAYAISFSWITLLSHISLVGFDVLITREMNNPDHSDNVKSAILNKAGFISVVVSFILGAGLFAFAWYFYEDNPLEANSYLKEACLIAAAAIPLFTLMLLLKAYMKGVKQNVTGMIPETILRPGLLLIGLICFIGYFGSINVEWIILLNIIAIFIGLFAAILFVKKHDLKSTEKIPFDKKYWKPALTFFFLSFVMMANNQSDLLMLSFWDSTSDHVGAYNIALKLTNFIAMPLVVMNAVIAPYLVEYFKDNKLEPHLKAIKNITRLIFVFGAILSVSFFLFPAFFLGLFGPENQYQMASIPLIILGFGQLYNVLLGAVGNALNMAGSEKIVFIVSAITLVINLALNAILIPYYGLIGASIGTIVSLVVWNSVLAVALKRKHGVNISII